MKTSHFATQNRLIYKDTGNIRRLVRTRDLTWISNHVLETRAPFAEESLSAPELCLCYVGRNVFLTELLFWQIIFLM